jgi:hypothetical protein
LEFQALEFLWVVSVFHVYVFKLSVFVYASLKIGFFFWVFELLKWGQ